MYVYVYTYTHVYVYMYMYVYVCMCMYMYMIYYKELAHMIIAAEKSHDGGWRPRKASDIVVRTRGLMI